MASPDYGYQEDDRLAGDSQFLFSEKSIRHAFIRKVYSILTAQLIVTMAIMAVFLYVEPVKQYSQTHIWLWILAFVMTFVALIVLACCSSVRRKFPVNFIMLGIFTICEGYLLGAVASYYSADTVLIAVGITAIVVFGLTVFAFQTKWDFTMCSAGLFVLVLILIIFGIFAAIFNNRVVDIVYASLGAIIFSMYLVFDTQLMMGGKHQYSISPEEYIFATLNLYLDIINLFLFILQLVGAGRDG